MSASAMHAPHTPSGNVPEKSDKLPVKAIAGNVLEFYDFIVYSFFAVYIGQTFFPLGSETASLLAPLTWLGTRR